MQNLYEVDFTIYETTAQTSYTTNLDHVRVVVQATTMSQAQEMIEAQYGGRAKVWSVFPK